MIAELKSTCSLQPGAHEPADVELTITDAPSASPQPSPSGSESSGESDVVKPRAAGRESCAQRVWRYRTVIGFALSCFLFTLGFAIANWATAGENPWGGVTNPAMYGRCEHANPSDLLREPANALSNLGFVFVGVYFLLSAWRDFRTFDVLPGAKHYLMGNFPMIEVMVGGALIFEGYGSFHMHSCAGKCEYGGFMDLAGIFGLIWSLLVACSFQVCLTTGCYRPGRGLSPRGAQFIAWVPFMAVGAYLSARWDAIFLANMGFANLKKLMLAIFALLFVLLGAAIHGARHNKLAPNHDYVLIPLALLSVLVAVLAWYPEEVAGYCVDTSLQLHAIWHIFLSLSIGAGAAWIRCVGRVEVAQHGLLAFLLLKDNAVFTADKPWAVL
jgi:hypothetical protein